MKIIPNNTWQKLPEWHGNPSLGFDCWVKAFTFLNRKIPVYVYGLPDSDTLSFCVSAGANSGYSYSGCFFPQKLNWVETMAAIDEKYKNNKLIY